jgi:hydrogenase expression/formation protein HypE
MTADPSGWVCPAPLRHHQNIVMGHGGGGRLSADLIEHLIVPAFAAVGGDADPARLADAATLDPVDGRLAFTTDSYVVRPRFFPGGCIGDLAVNGTVNDLAMVGARPLYLSVGFVLEEGLPLAELAAVVGAIAAAAQAAGVRVVTGDTKVVDAGHGDGIYINTAGVGDIPDGVEIGPERVQPGDELILSGPIGRHGIAVLSVREGLEFGTEIRSDTAPVADAVAALMAAGVTVHALRDPTRGGVAATLNELAAASAVGFEFEESEVPVPAEVRAACGFLGLDPLTIANEGCFVAAVPADQCEAALAVLHDQTVSATAVRFGRAVAEHPGVVLARTAIGGSRVVDRPLAEPLPRIC